MVKLVDDSVGGGDDDYDDNSDDDAGDEDNNDGDYMEIGDGDNDDGDDDDEHKDDDEDNDDSEDQFCEFWLPLAGKSEQNLSPRFPPTINERDSFLRLFSFFNLSFELLNGHSDIFQQIFNKRS